MVRLRYAGLSLPYKRSLHDAWDWVVQEGQHLGFPPHGSTAEVWDRFLERLVQRSFDRGVSIQQVVLGILSVQRRKRISGSLLAGAWQAIKGWKAMRPSRPRTPITRHLLEALVLAAFSKGYNSRGATRERWWAAALGFWLGFECLLRPGEVLGLKVRDVVVPEDMLAGPDAGVVLVLQTPKTRRVWRKQFVISHGREFNNWLIWWLADRRMKQQVFSMSMSTWRNMLVSLCQELQLTHMKITLGSLRAGGATWHFREHSNLGSLQFYGRWKSSSSVEHYLHDAMACFATTRVPKEAVQLVADLRQYGHLLKGPPAISARQLLNFCLE